MIRPLPVPALIMALLGSGVLQTGAASAAGDPAPLTAALDARHCGAEPVHGTEPRLRVWRSDMGWTPPACTGWTESGFHVLVEVTGPVLTEGGLDELLTRLGAISRLKGLRYWSVSEDGWEVLVEDAAALSAPDPSARRPDFKPEELRSGAEHFFIQTDNRTRNPILYRLRIVDRRDDYIVVTVENLTPMTKLMLTIAEPGALQSLHILARGADGRWSYRLLSRTGLRAMSRAAGRAESLANRAAALFAHVAGSPLRDGSVLP